MKKPLMNYCQRAYAAAMTCEAYGCAAGYQLGHTETWHYQRNAELAKLHRKLVFPANLGIVPVAVFTVGVTCRLVTAFILCSILRVAVALVRKSGKTELRPLPPETNKLTAGRNHDEPTAK